MAGNPSKWRLLVGFAVLPPAQWLVAYLAFPLVWWLGDEGAFRAVADDGAQRFAWLAGILGVGLTVCAVPVVVVLRRLGAMSLGPLLLAGLLIGNVPFAVFVTLVASATVRNIAAGTIAQHLMPFPDLLAGTLRAVLIGSSLGVLSAALFWLVSIRSGSDAPSLRVTE